MDSELVDNFICGLDYFQALSDIAHENNPANPENPENPASDNGREITPRPRLTIC